MRWRLLPPFAFAFVFLVCAGASAATPAKDAAEIDTLLKDLRAAPDEQAARILESRLRDVWHRAGSPASALLLDRATRELQSSSPDSAIDDADAVLILDPDYAQAFTVRAAAKLMAGDSAGAVRDAAEALRREPRDIGALMVLSHAAEERGNMKAAYETWQKLLELDPKTQDAQSRLNDLRRRAMGEDI